MINTQQLFKKAFDAGRDVQQKEHSGEEVDGRVVWQMLEKELGELKDKNLTDYTDNELKYNSTLETIYEEMEKIISTFEMDVNEYEPKSNHFFCQLINLVKKKSNFKIQLNRIMQLGFNAGQLSIFIERDTLPEDRKRIISDFVLTNKLFKLKTYVNKDIQEIINSKYLRMSGGYNQYYTKYIKYKNKYLLLKKLNF